MPKKRRGKKEKSGTKKGSKFGRIYGSLVGKGYSNEEAAAIAYKAVGESKVADALDKLLEELRESRK